MREILYKNIAIIGIQHSKMYFVDTFGDFSHTVEWNSLESVWIISLYGKFTYTVVRNIEWTNNSKIVNFWSQRLIFQIEKILKFLNFPIWQNSKTSKNFQCGKFRKFGIWQIQKNSIWKFPKICNLETQKKNSFSKISKTCNVANSKN